MVTHWNQYNSRVLLLNEIQLALTTNWTQVAELTFHDDSRYTMIESKMCWLRLQIRSIKFHVFD